MVMDFMAGETSQNWEKNPQSKAEQGEGFKPWPHWRRYILSVSGVLSLDPLLTAKNNVNVNLIYSGYVLCYTSTSLAGLQACY